jgi:hypothetical protein
MKLNISAIFMQFGGDRVVNHVDLARNDTCGLLGCDYSVNTKTRYLSTRIFLFFSSDRYNLEIWKKKSKTINIF